MTLSLKVSQENLKLILAIAFLQCLSVSVVNLVLFQIARGPVKISYPLESYQRRVDVIGVFEGVSTVPNVLAAVETTHFCAALEEKRVWLAIPHLCCLLFYLRVPESQDLGERL